MTAAVKLAEVPAEDAEDAPYILGGKHTQTIVKLIDAAHDAGVTPILWGKPGVGKTALVDALAQRPGFGGLVRVLTGSQDKSDTLGMPSRDTYTDRDGHVHNTTSHATPSWVLEANDSEGTFYVFLDELPQADTDVQGTFLTVLQNYVMPSGVKIKPHVKFIAAGNPTDIVASGYELIEPLTNRLSHLTYEPPREEWFQGMLDAWGKDVSDDEAALRRAVVGYLVGHGDNLHRPPETGSTENAWPSRRSWDNLSRMGAAFLNDAPTLEAVAESLVGEAVAKDFVTTVFLLASHTPDEIVADPSIVDWNNTFQGFVSISSVISWLSRESDVSSVIAVFNYAVKNGPRDVTATQLKALIEKCKGEFGANAVKHFKSLDMTDAGFKEFLPLIFGAKTVAK